MASIKENPCICIQCDGTIRYCTSNENEKRCHVAIVHGKETFSSLRCGKCQRKYFDLDHFTEHLETSQGCHKDSWMIKPEPLSAHLEMAFAALVEQMMRPVETDQMEKAPISGGNGDGKMDRTSEETWKRSMDGVKRKRVEDTSATDDQSSTKRQRNSVTRTTNKIGKGKRKKNKKSSINMRRARKAGRSKRLQQSNDTDGSSGRGTGKTAKAGGDANSANVQVKIQSSIVRREYCLDLIDKFSTAGKLQCQLCSAKCNVHVFQTKGSNPKMATIFVMQHALSHLKLPIYCCRICNITKFTKYNIRQHVRNHYSGNEEGYEDCSDQYHQQIMDILGQCFDSRKKRPVEQGERVSARAAYDSPQSEGECVNKQFELRSSIVRRQYCVDLIDKFAAAGKLQCQLCSAEFAVFRGASPKRFTQGIAQHALGHLKKPLYRCRICNITKFTVSAMRCHIREHHPSSDEGYDECVDQYHQEIMDTMRLCFHVDEKKRGVEQVEKKLSIPGRCYDNMRSPMHNERLHYVRRLVSRYSNQTRIDCQLCSKTCRLNAANSGRSIRNHAMVHVNKDIFQCILCGTGIKSYSQLNNHLQRCHQLKRGESAYMDYSDKYHKEFMNMLGKCFDPLVKKSKKKADLGTSGRTRKKARSGNEKTTFG